MKSKTYLKPFKLHLLHEELDELEGFVTLQILEGFGEVKIQNYAVSLIQDGINLSIPDELDFPDATITAHDVTKESKAEKNAKEKKDKKDVVLLKLGITEQDWEDLIA